MLIVGCSIDTEGLAPFDRALDGGARDDALPPRGDGCVRATPAVELCDGADNDCDPGTADGSEDPDVGIPCDGGDDDLCEEGLTVCVGRMVVCDDLTANAHETCNGTDDDCDTFVDEAALDSSSYYLDGDGDGFGVDGTQIIACEPPAGHAAAGGDCDDDDGEIFPTNAETCNLLDDDCSGTIDDGPGCACVGHAFGAHVYLFCLDDADWATAQGACVGQGGHLVYVGDMAEHSFLVERTNHYRAGAWWIGLTDGTVEMSWRWADGSAPAFTAWNTGEPNDGDVFTPEDCAEMNGGPAGAWNDTECRDRRPYVCEVP